MIILSTLVDDSPGIFPEKFNEDYQNIQNADVQKFVDYFYNVKMKKQISGDNEFDEWAKKYATNFELRDT
jgi:hypothetical protein